MSAKSAFFGIFQKIMVICCAIFFGFANAFSANLPSGYTELEYIKSSNSAFLDTGYILQSDNIKYEWEAIDAAGSNSSLFGSETDTTPKYSGILHGSPSSRALYVGDNGSLGVGYATDTTSFHSWVLDITSAGKASLYKDGMKTRTVNWTVPIQKSLSIYIFSNHARAQYANNVSLKYFKITDNNELKVNLVPAQRDSDGKIGMYDLAGNRFITNTQGNLIAGPMACPGGTLQTYTTVAATDVPAPVQNGTPTPTNPIEPVFYQQGKMTLRRIGDIADSYDATTGKITRRIMAKVFNGTESFSQSDTGTSAGVYRFAYSVGTATTADAGISTHFSKFIQSGTTSQSINTLRFNNAGTQLNFYVSQSTLENFKQWLAEQYSAGTPVTVYYPLATPVEEDWAAEQCDMPIKIATTAYNAARFSPVVTDLNSAVATIREIVTKTINQTAAIASLQADKQTRPEDACPAGKKCLLVETEENGVIVPHWFPIIENIYGLPSGYTPLEYIQSDGNSWIETDHRGTEKTGAYLKYQYHTLSSNLGGRIFGYRISEQNQWVAYIGTYTGTTVNTTTYYIQSGAMSTSPEGMPTLDRNIHEVKINTDGSGKIYFDSSLVGNSLGATAFTASKTLRLFSAYNNSSYSNATARIYEAGIYENGVIQKHFVPAKHGTTVGMYDTVNNVFYTNAGTGTFTAGPEI